MPENKELKEIREKIDKLDSQLLSLFNDRLILAKQAGEKKKDKVVYRPEREASIYKNLKLINDGPLEDHHIVNIFNEVISSCRSVEEKMEIAFLGPEGTYSDSALKAKFGTSINKNPTDTIEEVFKRVKLQESHYGIVPIENSTEGTINNTFDCLASYEVRICGEMEMKIHHNLLGLNKALPSEGFEIHAHEQTLSQCRKWLDSHCPGAKRIAVSSNALAAKKSSGEPKILAIAGKLAAEKYGLDIIQNNIEDYPDNTTRFVTLGLHEVGTTGNDKTSLMVTTKNEPGALYKVLKPIKENNLNLTHLTYRPSKLDKWNYSFFLDFEGHEKDKNVKLLLEELSNSSVEIKILGSYPQAEG